ncbi:GSCFA domain-containing protein [Rubellimicrobium mesophilum]|uniref:GSCFA domain-containing protein n=1 Tax=Rubellimicrobium mesophilum TaxID=1123067 RepID=UPI002480BB9C|nr:GSCFA domain-containing protein [Rubellimicrobium mesophilum]
MSFGDVRTELRAALDILRKANPKLQFILTVSPVPLTATKSGKHVLVATMQSKSVLRAVAGHIADRNEYVDYFPSYEIISSPVFRGGFFEPNQRGVTPTGVSFVMDTFFRELERKFGPVEAAADASSAMADEDLVCEEELLGAFGDKRT